MNEAFESFDYLKVTVANDMCSQYMDGYACFGWKQDENLSQERSGGKTTLHFKRSRSIVNKTELRRLQQHYEACMREISELESSKTSVPASVSISCGLIGCAFMAGSVFAITAEQPVIWLMIVLAVPGFILWTATYWGYKVTRRWRTAKVEPLIEAKFDEAYSVCAKAQQLTDR